ncbi:MAG TPA: hypothetical protein VFZ58_00310 [Candidatus Saccharimonadales bacterium]
MPIPSEKEHCSMSDPTDGQEEAPSQEETATEEVPSDKENDYTAMQPPPRSPYVSRRKPR